LFSALKQLYLLFDQVDDGTDELIEMFAHFIKQKKTVKQAEAKNSNAASPKSPNRIPLSVTVVNEFLGFKSLLFNSILSKFL
jgi:hypothetical protein